MTQEGIHIQVPNGIEHVLYHMGLKSLYGILELFSMQKLL